ncbi:MAG: amidohydrolase [Proteobacteria bacterium]|nr:amidohydrolase [Pseudomonadota bacterium]
MSSPVFDLGIRAGRLLTMKGGHGEVLENGFVGIRGDRIVEVAGFQDRHSAASREFLDLSGHMVMPGLVNAHTHLPMSLFRGFEDDVPFHEWLFKRIFPVEAELVDADFVRTGAELSALECIRFGTTTVNEMYFHAPVSAEVLDRAGLRAWVAWPFMDFPLPDEKNLGADALPSRERRFLEFFERYKDHPRIRPSLGPHAPYTCSDEVLLQVIRLSEACGVPIHMHVAETAQEVQDSIEKYGKTPVRRLSDLGLLSPRFFAAHCVHFSDADRALFEKSGASVLYNPDSNLKLGSGVAPIPAYRKSGIPVGIGSDGPASNNDLSLFGAMDLGTKIQKLTNRDNTAMGALDALNLATLEGARALGLENEVGSIEPGKRADVIGIRTDYPHLQPLHSVLSQLVYSCQGLEVDTVVGDGRLLLREGKFQTLKESEIYTKADRIRSVLKDYLKNNPIR